MIIYRLLTVQLCALAETMAPPSSRQLRDARGEIHGPTRKASSDVGDSGETLPPPPAIFG